MLGAVLYGPRDVRFEERDIPRITKSTDAIIRISATCVCGSDLWPYRGINAIPQPTPMGHEYCGIVEEVGNAVTSVKPGQFVIVLSSRPTILVPIVRSGISRLASTPNSSALRRRVCCACRLQTAPWSPLPLFLRTT